MNREKILRKIKRLNNKKLFIFSIFLIILFIFSDIHTIEVKADTNYSNYLTSESVSASQDKALILVQSADSSNNYRNYYETNFLFPNKLSTDMYSTQLTTNPAKYYISQTYLDNLDNDYAFKNVDNLGQYETNGFIESNDSIIINDGSYISQHPNSTILKLYPNQDILTNWRLEIASTHSEALRNPDASCVWCGDARDGFIDSFGLDNPLSYLNYSFNITSFTIYTYGERWQTWTCTNDFMVWINSTNYNFEPKIIDYSLNKYTYYSNQSWTCNLDLNEVNSLNISVKAPSNILTNDDWFVLYEMYLAFNITIYNDNILQHSDNNYYTYQNDGTGITGLFPALYSFTDDSIGSNPAGWSCTEPSGTSIQVISSLGEHNKIVELYDNSGSNQFQFTNSFSAQTYGTMEFWFRTTDSTKQFTLYIRDGTNEACDYDINDGYFRYYTSSWVNIAPCSNNQWYHIRIDFECGAGGYNGLSADTSHIYINGVHYGDYGFRYAKTSLSSVNFFSSAVESNHYDYLDAIDYSWSSGYYVNRNYYDAIYELNLTSNLEIDRMGNDFDNLESLELEYTVKSNVSTNLELYCKNVDTQIFDLVNTETLTTSFQGFTYTFVLNYTYFSSIGLVNFTFYNLENEVILFSFDNINLKATFSNYTIIENGYHSLELSFNRKTSGGTNRGNISLSLDLYKTNISYTYLENNVIESDYTKNGFIDFSNKIDDIYECEIQAHIRYGLNTLDIDIVNVYYVIWINYEYNFTIFEQLRNGNNDGNYFRYEMNYEANNFIRLNNTGIFGNYSYSCLKGLRVLRGDTSQNYNRYFTIPYFDEKIDITKVREGLEGSGGGSEPVNPVGYYWSYQAFKITYGSITGQNIGNWSIDWQSIQTTTYTAKYYYNPKTIKRSDLGDWSFKVTGDYKVSFNFMRNALCDTINLILMFFQFVWFLLVASLSYIFTFIAYSVIVLLYNYPLYYLWIGILYGLWYIVVGLYAFGIYFWDLLQYVWITYLIPFFDWFSNVAVPYIVEYIIIPAVAFTITLIIWIITLGNIDFWELYNVIYDNLLLTSDIFIDIIQELIEHIVEVVIFIGLYFLLIGMCFIKHIVVKARGFVNRAEALKQSYEAYLYPIEKGYIIASRIKEILANWM